VSVVAAYLRTLGIRLAVYLDDWLIVNQNKRQLLSDRENCLNLLKSLDFLVNKEKSTLIPTQTLIYLGGLFHLDKGLIYPTQERIVKLNLAIENLLTQEKASALMFLHLLGIMASCLQMILNARLFMRPVQLHLLSFWRPSSHNLTVKIPVTPHLKSHLIWWSSSANTLKGQSFQFPKMSVVITTDASKKGFGGFMNEQIFQGNWTHAQSKRHINFLEMEAVFLTMKHFLTQIKDQAVLIRSDNTTSPIHKQTGRHEVSTNMLSGLRPVEYGYPKQYSIENISRSAQSDKNTTNRMVFEQSSSSESFSNLGSTLDRFICIGTQSTDRDILLLESPSGSFGSRCFINLLGENVCLCIPPNMPDSSSDTIYEAIPLSKFTDCTPMAQETLVSGTTTAIDSSSNLVTNISGITLSTQNSDLPSEPTSVQSDCMASINKRYESEGFSEEARKLLSASWRKGTQTDYCSKFKQFIAGVVQGKLIPIQSL
jgi:hypothetical protein